MTRLKRITMQETVSRSLQRLSLMAQDLIMTRQPTLLFALSAKRRTMPKVSKHFGTIYDIDNDADFEVDRLDHIEEEEVLAYVPHATPYRNLIVQAIADTIENLGHGNTDDPGDEVTVSTEDLDQFE
jgi:hypothetical protein